MSIRQEQIASTIRRAVQEILVRGLSDPRVRGLLTVTRVEVTGDLRQADVFVSIYPEEHQALSFRGLESSTLRLQRELNERLAMRRPPHIRFRLDESIKKDALLQQLLRRGPAGQEQEETLDDLRSEFDEPDDAVDHDPDAGHA